jgi:hypothetical protein
MGTGRKDEETKDKTTRGYEMTNVKAQSPNQIQSPKHKEAILRFIHLTLI